MHKNILTVVGITFLFLSLAVAPSINANISKASVDSDSVELSSEIYGLDDENVHIFCYMQSGKVEHRNWGGNFSFLFPIQIRTEIGHFGFGSFYVHLKGEGDEHRLTVSKILRTTIYTEDINVSVKGFIGVFQPTGGLSEGFLFGFSMITCIAPL